MLLFILVTVAISLLIGRFVVGPIIDRIGHSPPRLLSLPECTYARGIGTEETEIWSPQVQAFTMQQPVQEQINQLISRQQQQMCRNIGVFGANIANQMSNNNPLARQQQQILMQAQQLGRLAQQGSITQHGWCSSASIPPVGTIHRIPIPTTTTAQHKESHRQQLKALRKPFKAESKAQEMLRDMIGDEQWRIYRKTNLVCVESKRFMWLIGNYFGCYSKWQPFAGKPDVLRIDAAKSSFLDGSTVPATLFCVDIKDGNSTVPYTDKVISYAIQCQNDEEEFYKMANRLQEYTVKYSGCALISKG